MTDLLLVFVPKSGRLGMSNHFLHTGEDPWLSAKDFGRVEK